MACDHELGSEWARCSGKNADEQCAVWGSARSSSESFTGLADKMIYQTMVTMDPSLEAIVDS